MTTMYNRLRRAGLRVCPPCDNLCDQGRDCPAAQAAPIDDHAGQDWLTRRSLELEVADLRLKNEALQRQLNFAVAGLVASVAFAGLCLTQVPW